MKKMNEIKNEKRLTKYVEYIHGSYYDLRCDKCPLDINSCDYVCDEVLADRLAKYEDIGRDIFNLPEDEVVPVEILELSLKIAKSVCGRILDTIFNFCGKENKDKNDESRKNK